MFHNHHGGRPTKGKGSKRKGVEEYAAEHWTDLVSQMIVIDGQNTQSLVCRFCYQRVCARSDRIKAHFASKRHQRLKFETLCTLPVEGSRDSTTQQQGSDAADGGNTENNNNIVLLQPTNATLQHPDPGIPSNSIAPWTNGEGCGRGGGMDNNGLNSNVQRQPIVQTPTASLLELYLSTLPPPVAAAATVNQLQNQHLQHQSSWLSSPSPSSSHHRHSSYPTAIGRIPPPPPNLVKPSEDDHQSATPTTSTRTKKSSSYDLPQNTNNNSDSSSSASQQQLLCVSWNNVNIQSNAVTMFTKFRSTGHFLDATLFCEGKTIKCHQLILSTGSTYFEKLLTENPNPNPIIFFTQMRYWQLESLVDFMYRGEVHVTHDKLQSLLKAAESLQVKGLYIPSTANNEQEQVNASVAAGGGDGLSALPTSQFGDDDHHEVHYDPESGGDETVVAVGLNSTSGGHGEQQTSLKRNNRSISMSSGSHSSAGVTASSSRNTTKRRKDEATPLPRKTRRIELPRVAQLPDVAAMFLLTAETRDTATRERAQTWMDDQDNHRCRHLDKNEMMGDGDSNFKSENAAGACAHHPSNLDSEETKDEPKGNDEDGDIQDDRVIGDHLQKPDWNDDRMTV
jgi:hypothetical protein